MKPFWAPEWDQFWDAWWRLEAEGCIGCHHSYNTQITGLQWPSVAASNVGVMAKEDKENIALSGSAALVLISALFSELSITGLTMLDKVAPFLPLNGDAFYTVSCFEHITTKCGELTCFHMFMFYPNNLSRKYKYITSTKRTAQTKEAGMWLLTCSSWFCNSTHWRTKAQTEVKLGVRHSLISYSLFVFVFSSFPPDKQSAL